MTTIVNYAVNTASSAVGYAVGTASGIVGYVNQKAIETVEFGKVVLTGATTTVISHTPNQIVQLIQATSDSCKATVQDPVGSAKNYIPAFVIHLGERSYEIALETKSKALETKDMALTSTRATSGLIIHKVNGVVERIVAVPQVHVLLERLEQLTLPVLNRFGIEKNPLGYILHDEKTGNNVLITSEKVEKTNSVATEKPVKSLEETSPSDSSASTESKENDI